MSDHLRAFARHLIEEREGAPVAIATLVAVFTNLGNALPGDTPAHQRTAATEALLEDEGLAVDLAAGTVDTIDEGESAEAFAARRAAGRRA